MPVKFLDLRIFGTQEVQHELFNGMSASGHMKPVLDEVADDMMDKVIAVNFSSEGRRGGGSWKRLEETTKKRRIKKGYPDHPILVMTGAMKRSVTERGDENMELNVTNRTIWLGSALGRAPTHHYGGGHSNVAARPFMDFLFSDELRWAKMCEDYLMSHMSRLR